MSSGIAAPIGGRFFRARTLGHDSAREHERKRLRRHLRVTTLGALEGISTAEPDADAGTLVAAARDVATELRAFVGSLSGDERHSPVGELRRHVGATLHDTTLQALEYLGADGYGAQLSTDEVRRIAADAAVELRGTLLRLGAPEPCELVSGLRQVVSAAQRRGAVDVELVTDGVDGRVCGADAAALVGAVREALNNVHKHANASRVLVRCEASSAGARVIVRDDGVGADLSRVEEGFGLRHSILERMVRRGGHARLHSAPGEGMLITLSTTAGPKEVAA
jgi:signal transduction histidine kinase